MVAVALLLVGLPTLQAHPANLGKDHENNPIFRELISEGLDLGGKLRAKLPAPTMPEGLDAAEQKKIIEKLITGSQELDDFLRNSVVAPHILRLGDIASPDPKVPIRTADFWFVAHGSWEKIGNKEFWQRYISVSSTEAGSKMLTRDQLAKRKITLSADEVPFHSYGYGKFNLFSKVEISGTGHSYWTRTPQSHLIAGALDARFLGDAEFPNQWRPLQKDDDGKTTPGPAQPYQGVGYYVKVTRLHEPAGAVFVEGHVIFAEPTAWFGGANFLRSRLPLVVQNQVRAIRRELLK